MKKILTVICFGLLGCYLQGESDLSEEEIIKQFTAKESEFKKVWKEYSYSQNIVFQVLNRSGNVREEREVWSILQETVRERPRL